MKRNIFFFKLLILTLLIMAILALSACQPKHDTSAEPQVLVVWDQFKNDQESAIIEQLNQEFEKKHPGVTIQREVKLPEQLNAKIDTAFKKEDGPDIVQITPGRQPLGDLVKNGLVMPLDAYAAQYDWARQFPATLLARNSFDENGKRLGEGQLYGVSPTTEIIGVYYNKHIFSQNGWKIPSSFAEFQFLLESIQKIGIVPIAIDSSDRTNLIHLFSAIQNLFLTRETSDDLIYIRKNASLESKENLNTAFLFYEWHKNGFLVLDSNNKDNPAASSLFQRGDAAMTIGGSWLGRDLSSETETQFGFFTLPGFEGHQAMTVCAPGNPFVIRATSSQPDLAAEYINWMVSDHAARLWADAGFIPAMSLPKQYKSDGESLLADILRAWQFTSSNDLLGHPADWATPSMRDRMLSGFQRMFESVITPEVFIQEINQDYQDWKPYLR